MRFFEQLKRPLPSERPSEKPKQRPHFVIAGVANAIIAISLSVDAGAAAVKVTRSTPAMIVFDLTGVVARKSLHA